MTKLNLVMLLTWELYLLIAVLALARRRAPWTAWRSLLIGNVAFVVASGLTFKPRMVNLIADKLAAATSINENAIFVIVMVMIMALLVFGCSQMVKAGRKSFG